MTERNLEGMREVLGEGTFQGASCKCRVQPNMQSYALGRSLEQKATEGPKSVITPVASQS